MKGSLPSYRLMHMLHVPLTQYISRKRKNHGWTNRRDMKFTLDLLRFGKSKKFPYGILRLLQHGKSKKFTWRREHKNSQLLFCHEELIVVKCCPHTKGRKVDSSVFLFLKLCCPTTKWHHSQHLTFCWGCGIGFYYLWYHLTLVHTLASLTFSCCSLLRLSSGLLQHCKIC